MTKEKSQRKRWVFGATEGRTYILSPAAEQPGRFVGDVYYPPKKSPELRATFNYYSKLFVTEDPVVAELLMKHRRFRHKRGDEGTIWLVKEEVINEKTGLPETAPPPEPTPATQVVAGPRGTGRPKKEKRILGAGAK